MELVSSIEEVCVYDKETNQLMAKLTLEADGVVKVDIDTYFGLENWVELYKEVYRAIESMVKTCQE